MTFGKGPDLSLSSFDQENLVLRTDADTATDFVLRSLVRLPRLPSRLVQIEHGNR